MQFHTHFRQAGRAFALSAAFWALGAQALTITSVSPQGEVAKVRQLVAKFSENAVNFGDPKAPSPLKLTCDDATASRGQGRWNSAREWVYEFESDLPPGVRCRAEAVAGFKTSSGSALTGTTQFQFNTGGPFVQQISPSTPGPIEEEQVFILRLNGDATADSVRSNVWCAIDGVGEHVPVRLIEGTERTGLLKAIGNEQEATKTPQRYHALVCNRRLTPATRVQLVYGKGVATPSGIANTQERRFTYKVREPFTASMSCERENAQAACMPIRPVTLNFTAPVSRRILETVRLRSSKNEFKPSFDEGDADALVDRIQFNGPLPERTPLTLALPPDLKDASGRALSNASTFPLQFATAPMPPLAKFAAQPFGIVERFADGPESQPLFPVTLRRVESNLNASGVQVSGLRPQSDPDIIDWFRRIQRYDGFYISRKLATKDLRRGLPPVVDAESKETVQSRMVSLLAGVNGVQTLHVPPSNDGQNARPFEVVGIPLVPGFHVLEISSQLLGASLLDEKFGPSRTMYVRSSALVTNLGVHFKLGRDNSLAWVTSLDKGQPVAGATVRVSDCRGRELAKATTDIEGIARFKGLSPAAPVCQAERDDYSDYPGGYFVSARTTRDTVDDLAFTWSSWQKGIEPWRFNVPTSNDVRPDERAHTVFDRTLLRAGETVSMKHLLRSETSAGFGLPQESPDTLVVTHVGSGQEYTQPLAWRRTKTGGRSTESTFAIPQAAKLGVYQVTLRQTSQGKNAGEGSRSFETGQFRVEEFRLPVFQGRVSTVSKEPLIAATNVPVNVQVNYVAGGAAGNLPVRISALTRAKDLRFTDYDDFKFDPPRTRSEQESGSEGEEEATSREDQRVVADKLAVTLDRNGSGTVAIDKLAVPTRPQDLLIEATYADPNGEIQTLRGNGTLWPAGVVVGIKTEGWVSASQAVQMQALALDLAGKPKAGVTLDVKAIARITTTSRKRMVGGFYTYDNRTETKDLGTVCTGSSDSRGLLTCSIKMNQPGEIELVVTARDDKGRTVNAASSVWVTKQGELWFGGENHDRMDLVPEKKLYQPGETARFQVRMPFRYATALVAVEREGVMHTQLVQLRGDDPTVSLKIEEAWGPNAYVSVLALRGRLRDVPWYSFFSWGYKAPREWWQAFWHDSKDYVAPTAMVDLSKPAFRLGMTEIRIGTGAHRIDVSVKADKESYTVRGKAKVTITAKLPNGQPAADAEVALAAVDQALLELMPNGSWNLLDAMMQRRAWGVETSTAQMEIIGRRHYGRKAVPTGGDGGGRNPTRELLDTLLLWNPRVQLDAQGQAVVEVPLNDALTTFQIVAVADSGTGLFGTGQTAIKATQDLQIISGLPPLVREGDQFKAMLTLRNTTQKAMKVEVSPRATLLELKPQTIEIPAGEARELQWDVTAPAQLAATRAEALMWEIEAKDSAGTARDALKVSQRIIPAVPLTVQQATLEQLNGSLTLDVAPPADALPLGSEKRGGVRISLQPRLSEGLPGVRDWFARYPYSCLEQKTSKSIGLRDEKLWQQTVAQLPAYLDSDGLASYFPPNNGESNRGSDTLTAWLLAATHAAGQINTAFTLPDEPRARMIAGLTQFVEGKIERKFWSPRNDLDVRKLAAIEALSRYEAAKPAMLSSLTIAPNQWPTSAVIDWISILKRLPTVPNKAAQLAQAEQVLRARLTTQGTRLAFSTEQDDYWWWLMAGGDVNSARLLLLVMNDPAWKDDLGRLVTGFIARQQGGAWNTTTANLWGGLALEQFSKQHESTPVAGKTTATLGASSAEIEWSKVTRLTSSDSLGAAHQTSIFGAPSSPGQLTNNTALLSWGDAKPGTKQPLVVTQVGTGKPWVTLQSLAAVDLKAPFNSGYQIKKTVTPVEQANKSLPSGQYTRGDILRVTLEVTGNSDMTWVAVTDPVPAGATILGGGLGRDSQIATQGEQRSGAGWPAFEERSFEAFRSYYEYLPKGTVKVEYTVRLNNAGAFSLPPSRVEALYAPEMFGEIPNARVTVQAP
ncbi:alpha-2-macroglobulin family protein [Ottowia thiooxydans]|uniref:alpha-2-macroglobulin family protein n=1 Tax=Ottowia thiooxydans TaxID=219182 RepID=UPI0004192696|nr:MG2 domain-containing protein [Ottowia thiooxydans]